MLGYNGTGDCKQNARLVISNKCYKERCDVINVPRSKIEEVGHNK
jgi:hypothetical protein